MKIDTFCNSIFFSGLVTVCSFLAPLSAMPLSVSIDRALSAGSSITLTAHAVGGTSGYRYLWSTGETTENIIVQSTTPGTILDYSVTATDSNNHTCSASTTVTVQPPSGLTVIGLREICVGEMLYLTASAEAEAATYVWTGPNGLNVQDPHVMISNVQEMHSGTYSVILTDKNGCISQASATVTVLPCMQLVIEQYSSKLVSLHKKNVPYSIMITNTGTVPVTNVILATELSPCLTLKSIRAQGWRVKKTSHAFKVTLPVLGVDETATVYVTIDVSCDEDPESGKSIATVVGDGIRPQTSTITFFAD